jgi:hypothetical protein
MTDNWTGVTHGRGLIRNVAGEVDPATGSSFEDDILSYIGLDLLIDLPHARQEPREQRPGRT